MGEISSLEMIVNLEGGPPVFLHPRERFLEMHESEVSFFLEVPGEAWRVVQLKGMLARRTPPLTITLRLKKHRPRKHKKKTTFTCRFCNIDM